MIFGKYQVKKRLGKGAYGDVMLVQDKKGNKYALKMISLKTFKGQNQYLREYLQSQINCLKKMNSPYVMKLYSTQEDKDYKGMLCQYCDGGDIISVQAKQPNKVFKLQRAIEILSFVIKGLLFLHQARYVHRDIKAENILMKHQDNKQIFKLADFGFTKNIHDISFTILGTGAYMSPQIYLQKQYGFGVDMWAFGVLFYFMLNMQFPFKPHLFPNISTKCQQLKKVATNFSYKSYVQKSRKKLTQNCTAQVEDLFKRIFDPKPEDRISFYDLRNHSIFKKYFVQKEEEQLSRIVYKQNKIPIKNILSSISKVQNEKISRINYSGIIKKNKQFAKQIKVLQKQKLKMQFLKQIEIEIQKNADLELSLLLNFKFNISKYRVMSLKKIISNLDESLLDKKYIGLQWRQFCKTNDFAILKKELEVSLQNNQLQLQNNYEDCKQNLRQIVKINPHFSVNFDKKYAQQTFEGDFKKSYRRSTILCYESLIKRIKKEQSKGSLTNYHLALITICHAFNKLFQQPQNMRIIFQDYFKELDNRTNDNNKNNSKTQRDETEDINNLIFVQLKSFMCSCTSGQLNAITKSIIDIYFKK